MADRETLLRTIYAAFNARDADAVLAAMTPDVDWPNGWEGGRVSGQPAVREYWLRQWSEIDPNVEPLAFTPRPDDRLAVTVAQHIRSLDGATIAEDEVLHVYTFTGDLVSAMEIEAQPPAST